MRALANLIEHLHTEHAFYIFTRNHDYLNVEPYAEIEPNVWHQQASASVYYSDRADPVHALAAQIEAVQPDWIYLNGALPSLTRACLRLRCNVRAMRGIPVLLAPHGNLSASALGHHRLRKYSWLLYAKGRSLYRDVIWHAASGREVAQIRAWFGSRAEIRQVPMAPNKVGTLEGGKFEGRRAANGTVENSTNNQSPLRLVYFGRLSPEKNLPFAFELLNAFAQAHPDRAVVYDLIGSGSAAYEAELRRRVTSLPHSVQVNFIGQLNPEALHARLQSSFINDQPSGLNSQVSGLPPQVSSSPYHALLMPSLTENFSYTVLESMQAGIPVLISDQTPWRDLQRQEIGWDLPLAEIDRWLQSLEDLVLWDDGQIQAQRQQARAFADKWASGYQRCAHQLFAPSLISHPPSPSSHF